MELILELPDAVVEPKDFGPLIAAGRRMRWTPHMIQSHEEMAARGKCFDFRWKTVDETEICGTLYEDNIFFSVVDDELATVDTIKCWGEQLDVRVFKH
ncbi:MAG: hypothetical protein AB7K24_27890 [Gemmataceae bacterium]